jgi:hypothetical protein
MLSVALILCDFTGMLLYVGESFGSPDRKVDWLSMERTIISIHVFILYNIVRKMQLIVFDVTRSRKSKDVQHLAPPTNQQVVCTIEEHSVAHPTEIMQTVKMFPDREEIGADADLQQ